MNNIEIEVKLPDDVLKIINKLDTAGYEVYVVGGCVRDSILNRPINDWDICTSATPEQIIEVFKDEYIIPTGLKHGTVTVMLNKVGYEVTTYRIDGEYTDNRRPDNVKFTNSLIEDLQRRDFTINAMAYNPEIGLIDPFDGLEDIKNKKIRCVGNAKDRFNEDSLRILRAIRFAAQLEFVVTPYVLYEINKMYYLLKNISMERINSEFCKIVLSEDFCVWLVLCENVFSFFITEIDDMNGFRYQDCDDLFYHIVHSIQYCESNDLITRLAVLFHDIGVPYSCIYDEDGIARCLKKEAAISAEVTNNIMKRLKFDNRTRENVVQLVRVHNVPIEANKKCIKELLRKIGIEQFKRLLDLKKANILGKDYVNDKDLKEIESVKILLKEIIDNKECFSLKDLAVNGNDIKKHINIKGRIEIGYWLNEILKMVINEELSNDREELISWMDNVKY